MKEDFKSVVVMTLGCKLNFAESSAMVQLMETVGYRQVKIGQPADVCIINTCSVTETADQKDRQAIHKIVRQYPQAYIIVAGCYAQLKPEEVAAIPGVDLVLGADYKLDLLKFLDRQKSLSSQVLTCPNLEISRFLPACAKGDRTRYFLKVQDGCDYFCSYCTVPFARGRSRCPSVEFLVDEARHVVEEGGKEIVLTGINVGTYGLHIGKTFLDLLQALDEVDGVERYRISSIEPNLLTDEIIRFVAHSKHFAPHFHIPLQSGNDEMLALMRRHYQRDLFASKVLRIKQELPEAFIGVDVIVGMRGETKERFSDAEAFIRELPISQLHVFSYSERPGTKALDIAYKVSPAEKKRRSTVLHQLSEEKRLAFYQSQMGKTLNVLFEHGRKNDCMYGFTENYVRVEAPYRKEWSNTEQFVCLTGFNADKTAMTII